MSKKVDIDDGALLKIGQYCRSQVDVHQGACFGRRVEYFHGDELVDVLESPEFRKKNFFPMPEQVTRGFARRIGEMMLEHHSGAYFHRAEITNKLTKSVDYDELDQMKPINGDMEDDDDAVYIWVMAPSRMKTVIYSSLLVSFGIACCMIKVWPLWMKIAVWWLSLIMLVSMLSLIVIRIFVAALFWVLGFKGLWLLPNMLNDDLDILDAFSPLIGYGITSREIREQAKAARIARAAYLNKSVKKKDSKKKDDESEEPKEAKPETESKVGKHEYDFGFLNVAFIMIFGLFLCNYLGLFMPENIPEFVTSRADLFAQFPSLAPPDYNATAEAEAAAAAAAAAESSQEGATPKEDLTSDGVKIAGMGESEEPDDDDIIDDVRPNEAIRNKFEGEEEEANLD